MWRSFLKHKLLVSFYNAVFGVFIVFVLQLFRDIEWFGWLQMILFAIGVFTLRFLVEFYSENVFQRSS